MSSTGKPDLAAWRLDPRLVEVDRLSRAGPIAAAVARARAMDAEGVEHPMLLNLIAWDDRRAGRLDAAITTLTRALQFDPGEPSLLISLGDAYAAAGHPREALGAFEAALIRAPGALFALGGKARALLRLGRYAEAELLFQRVLQADPAYVDALAGVAALACQRSDFITAGEMARAILALEPGNVEAVLVAAEAANARCLYAESEAGLDPLLARAELSRLDRATALILRGDALHGQKRFAPAFEAYRSGKAVYREAYRDVFEAPGVEREPERIARLTGYFASAAPSDWRPAPAVTAPAFARHAFLVGFPRSGTTLLENVFAAHGEVIALDEIPTLPEASVDAFKDSAGLDRLAALTAGEAEAQRRVHFDHVRAVRTLDPGKLLLEKMPLYTVYIPLIRKLFPEAKFIFALRDPRDVVLSCFRRRFVVNSAMYEFTDLADAAVYYDRVMTLAQTYFDRLDADILFVKNEDLIDDFDAWSRKLCAHIGLDWSESLQDFAEAARRRDIRTPSADQVRQGLNGRGVGQWRHYAGAMEAVGRLLQPWVERFGYAPE